MNVHINGCLFDLQDKLTAADIKAQYYPDADAVILNRVPLSDLSVRISSGDHILLLNKGSQPEQKELEWLMLARQPEAVTRRLKAACVGIAGAGGLGSVVAENLARAGVGRLVIADFDMVELSNLNRQRYSLSQLGMPKVQALADNIGGFNPFVKVVPVHDHITFENSGTLFQGCDIVAECLDIPADKASMVSGILKHMLGTCRHRRWRNHCCSQNFFQVVSCR
jgi:sulfur carrier protein ThiS adenylyltransferase